MFLKNVAGRHGRPEYEPTDEDVKWMISKATKWVLLYRGDSEEEKLFLECIAKEMRWGKARLRTDVPTLDDRLVGSAFIFVHDGDDDESRGHSVSGWLGTTRLSNQGKETLCRR